ncbi:MAG: metallophosphoesterase family protein [Silicimonas sp.]|nr:metallophosphoesterase family protein [Silicimonas sp.]
MHIQDFGAFYEGVTLFGGPYSNLQALQAFADQVPGPAICTGDVVAYGAEPAECVALMRARGWPVIAGNCEEQIAAGALDCGCGFEEGTACDALSAGWYRFAKAAIGEEARNWMGALPRFGHFTQKGKRYGVLHGGATAVNLFLWPDSAEAVFAAEIAALETVLGPVDGVVSGHSGVPFHRWIGRHQWINAGVIGLPPHDGRAETRYAVLAENDVKFHRLSYDAGAARAAMEAARLTQGYHETLTSGIWPSEDVLPTALRRG